MADRDYVGTGVEAPALAVFGMGFVGLPLALSFAMRQCQVTGVDVVQSLVDELNAGVTHHKESYKSIPIQAILANELAERRFRATTDAQRALKESSAIIVTVGIPVVGGTLVFEPLVQVCKTIADGLKMGDTVIIRSTVVPGTTEEVVLPILETSGLKAGVDFFLSYASERIAEGRAFEEFETMPCLVAGINQLSTEKTIDILGHVSFGPMVPGSSIKAVETTKVIENIQRDVNIAMIQEFARFTEKLGVDIFEVVRLANTHKRVHLLEPGPGVGGYCIPNALYYLLPKAEELKVNLDLVIKARLINDGVPEVVVGMVDQAVGPEVVRYGGTVAVVGLAMKDYSNDDRLSPATRVVELLLKKGYKVRAYDPAVSTQYPYKVDSLIQCCEGANCILILVKQHGVTEDAIMEVLSTANPNCCIVDTRNLISPSRQASSDRHLIRI